MEETKPNQTLTLIRELMFAVGILCGLAGLGLLFFLNIYASQHPYPGYLAILPFLLSLPLMIIVEAVLALLPPFKKEEPIFFLGANHRLVFLLISGGISLATFVAAMLIYALNPALNPLDFALVGILSYLPGSLVYFIAHLYYQIKNHGLKCRDSILAIGIVVILLTGAILYAIFCRQDYGFAALALLSVPLLAILSLSRLSSLE